MQPKTRKGPGVAAPEPLCIAYLANAPFPYSYNVVEGNQNSVERILKREGGLRAAWGVHVADQPVMLAEAPENVL